MSTNNIEMWQGIRVTSIKVVDVIRELEISKSYLYKLIEKQNIDIPKSETGRYFLVQNTITILKSCLNIEDSNDVNDIEFLIFKLG